MRYIFGIIGVLAALCFVAYAAVTSHHTAAAMTSQFPELAGWAAAGMVCWEALGALYVQQCWRNGSKWMALGGAVLVLAASIYLLRLDLRFHVAGQSDVAAAREVSVENRDIARSEFDKAVKRRDELQQKKTLTRTEAQDLADSKKRISELEPRLWGTETITAGGVPEANWASRMFSGISSDRQGWADAFMVAGLLFWALARMLALPVAVASMQMAYKPRVDAPGRAKASPATPIAPHPFAPVLRRPVTPEKAFQKPEEGTPSPVPVPGPSPKPLVEAAPVALEIDPTQFFEREMDKQNVVKFTTKQDRKKQRQKSKKNISEGDVTMWFQDCTTRVPEKDIAATSKECWESYQAWCQVNEYKPTSRKDLTRKMGIIWGRAAGSRGPRNADGAIWPGLKVVKPNAQPLRARA